MKRNKHLHSKKNYLGIVASVVILIILAIVIFSGSNDKISDIESIDIGKQGTQEVLDEGPLEEDQVAIETLKEESIKVSTNKVGEKGLCEDYFFEQGDSLEILTHEIRIDRIGADALRLNVDGENYVMSDDDSIYAGDGIRLSIAKDAILYFSSDDPSNAVMIRVGCRYDVDPNEKYVQDRGIDLCQEVFENCQASFDIKE